MANPEHLKILKQGVEIWNRWREDHPGIEPDLAAAGLSRTNLREANFSETDLRWADLRWANFRSANLSRADLRRANLSGAIFNLANLKEANLSETYLGGADLSEADLRKAYFIRADLAGVDFSESDLRRADFRWAYLIKAKFNKADLSEANLIEANLSKTEMKETKLREAFMAWSFLGDNDLSLAVGLDTVKHYGPSTIGIDTVYRSKGKIPEAFLRGAGVPDNFITYTGYLKVNAFEYNSCFISYAGKDKDFIDRINADLQKKGVRCWFAPEEMKMGEEVRQRVDQLIRIHDKLLLVLSKNSIDCKWIQKEVETAFEEECNRKKTVLFPIRLDTAIMDRKKGWAVDIKRTRNIGDFTDWENTEAYQHEFNRLLKNLKA